MNTADIIITVIIILAAAAAIASIIRRKKHGKGCSCGCESCNYNCEKKK